MDHRKYLDDIAATRDRRLAWWREARFGMFVHWGLYSILARHEWVMNKERIPVSEYEPLADQWKPAERPMRRWAELACRAGMKYMVMTTKHHEGFCLWDTRQTDYNAVERGPGRDLVAEYVETCREYGLKVGFYYSLMDWHHADGAACDEDEAACERFLEFTRGCVGELCSNYGKIDLLWYDVSWPLFNADQWQSIKMNRMVRRLQPDIIINNRSALPEDYSTPEEKVEASESGRDWEACMTFNGSWGYSPMHSDWHSPRAVLDMLRSASAGGGNLLLNIGPDAAGNVPAEATERLTVVGSWLEQNGEAVYGRMERTANRFDWLAVGDWTVKDHSAYLWCRHWPGSEFVIGGMISQVLDVSILATGEPVRFTQTDNRLFLKGMPETSPDKVAGVCVLKIECDGPPRHKLGMGCVTGVGW